MKVKRALILVVLVLASLPAGWALAGGGGPAINRFVIGSGGGQFAARPYVVEGTIGQAVTGKVAAGQYAVCSGFWCEERHVVYLPAILR